MLGSSSLMAFTTTAKPEAAKTFYRDTLRRPPRHDDRFVGTGCVLRGSIRKKSVDPDEPTPCALPVHWFG